MDFSYDVVVVNKKVTYMHDFSDIPNEAHIFYNIEDTRGRTLHRTEYGSLFVKTEASADFITEDFLESNGPIFAVYMVCERLAEQGVD